MQISVLSGPGNSESFSDLQIHDFQNPALVVAHPGHELKVFGWLSACKPRAFILTDGSGSGASRLHSTARVLRKIGIVPGKLFGPVSDAEIYRAILEQRMATFLEMVDRLAASLVENDTDFVAGDATEGFNPTHDICRALLNAAVAIAQRVTGRCIANYEFCLTEWEQHCREIHDQRCWHLSLPESLLEEKLRAAADYTELKAEIEQAIALKGKEYFRTECFRKVIEPFATVPPSSVDSKPYYETHGEERVEQDKYSSVIRYRQHMLPILGAVRDYALESVPYPCSTSVVGHP